jgi:IPT/TIG domain/Regulator of chromosome condensation (RCC1) repeat
MRTTSGAEELTPTAETNGKDARDETVAVELCKCRQDDQAPPAATTRQPTRKTVLKLLAGIFPAVTLVALAAPGAYGFTPGHCPNVSHDRATVMWGGNGKGELGLGYTDPQENAPRTVEGLTDVKELQPSFQFTMALLNNCTLESWGSNFQNPLGSGQVGYQKHPSQVSFIEGEGPHPGRQPLTEVKQVSVTPGVEPHVMALQYDGTVWTWGAAELGERGNGERGFSREAKIIEPKVAKPRNEPIPLQLEHVEQVGAGGTQDFALREGEVLAWGSNTGGSLGVDKGPVEAEESNDAKCSGLPSPKREVPCVLTPTPVQSVGPTGTLEPLQKVEKLAVGQNAAYAVRDGGMELLGWGHGGGGQLMATEHPSAATKLEWPHPSSPIVEVSAGESDVFVRLKNGEVWTWGDDNRGQLGIAPEALAEECNGHDRCTRKPVVVPELTNVVQIVAGELRTYALKELQNGERKIYSFGANGPEELLGLGSEFEGAFEGASDTAKPTPIEGLPSVASVAGGHTMGGAILESSSGPAPLVSLKVMSERAILEWDPVAPAYKLRWRPVSSKKFSPYQQYACPCEGKQEATNLNPEPYAFFLYPLPKGTTRYVITGKPKPPVGAPLEEASPELAEPPEEAMARVGEALTAIPGKWANATTLRFEWLLCEGYGQGGGDAQFGEECEPAQLTAEGKPREGWLNAAGQPVNSKGERLNVQGKPAAPGEKALDRPTALPREPNSTGTVTEAELEAGVIQAEPGQTLVYLERAENSASKGKASVAESEPVVVRGKLEDEHEVVPPAPTSETPPHIIAAEAKTTAGQTLKVDQGTWSTELLPQFTADAWLLCESFPAEASELAAQCKTITEEVSNEGKKETVPVRGLEYKTEPDEIGDYIEVRERVADSGGWNVTFSSPVKVEAPPPTEAPKNKEVPTIQHGYVQVGQQLAALEGSWEGRPTGYEYQWERCVAGECTAIYESENTKHPQLAKKSTYKIQAGDESHTIRVTVTASNGAGSTRAYSVETTVIPVPPKAPKNTALPVVIGSAVEGQELRVTPGEWSFENTGYTYPETITYQWQRCETEEVKKKETEVCRNIGGADRATYTPTAEDVHKRIELQEAAIVPGSEVVVDAKKVGPITAALPVNTKPPVITGVAQWGQRLAVVPGAWTNSPTTVEYDWERCGAKAVNGEEQKGCWPIGGATGPTYEPGEADVGFSIVVRETVSNEAGTQADSSEPTGKVKPHRPLAERPPGIVGSAERGRTLTATPAQWMYDPAEDEIDQWERCAAGECEKIPGATSNSYRLSEADVGHTIRVKETAANEGGFSREYSAETAVVTVPAPPAIAKVEPDMGPQAGGSAVVITGENLGEANAVTFGATAAASFRVLSAGAVEAVAPAGVAGPVDITVTTPEGGTSTPNADSQFTYVPPPAITSVEPSKGGDAGGTTVVITGENLQEATSVTFGLSAATSFKVLSATTIEATAPEELPGGVEITITTRYGGVSEANGHGGFTYVAPPSVSRVEAAKGPTAGANTVTITGEGFDEATAVDFGATPGAIKSVSASSISAEVPAAAAGTVDVTVTTRYGGTSQVSEADHYTYIAPPVISKIEPAKGPIGVPATTTISGENFEEVTSVRFGTKPTGIKSRTATSLTVEVPTNPQGTVDVTITTRYGGTSATGEGDRFTYVAAPVIAKVEPNTGTEAGGTTVVITGENLAEANLVKFGSREAAIKADSATALTVEAPAGAGTVDISIKTPYGTSATTEGDHYSYGPSPAVTKIAPASGPATGGQSVTITGKNLNGATGVRFGNASAEVLSVEATKVVARAPSEAGGEVHVTVTTPYGTSATSAKDLFSNVPAVTSVTPASGPVAGGTVVTVIGSGFVPGTETAIKFGSARSASASCRSTTECTARSPEHSKGTVDVTATVGGVSSATSSADQFTYGG